MLFGCQKHSRWSHTSDSHFVTSSPLPLPSCGFMWLLGILSLPKLLYVRRQLKLNDAVWTYVMKRNSYQIANEQLLSIILLIGEKFCQVL